MKKYIMKNKKVVELFEDLLALIEDPGVDFAIHHNIYNNFDGPPFYINLKLLLDQSKDMEEKYNSYSSIYLLSLDDKSLTEYVEDGKRLYMIIRFDRPGIEVSKSEFIPVSSNVLLWENVNSLGEGQEQFAGGWYYYCTRRDFKKLDRKNTTAATEPFFEDKIWPVLEKHFQSVKEKAPKVGGRKLFGYPRC